MDEHFTPITTTESLDALFTSSAERPVILFKHDPYCPISARAYREMERVQGAIALVDVENDKAIASAVTKRTGIRHESPQVIVVKDGQPVWSASQFNIKTDAVSQAAQAETPTAH
ncbi:MAG: bacillithiol system redox-active protein YtxJ [Chloroflexota bacterium]|nr:bacillithiol system redox-active protein YtxJ [Chloroflexota bacterium]MDQ6905415.1 bacillithiol system redox-active protein YtxJ [Chloroflexota bacterium]